MKFIYGILALAALAGMGWAVSNYVSLMQHTPGLTPWLLFIDAGPVPKVLMLGSVVAGVIGLLFGLVCAMRRPRAKPRVAPEILGVLLALISGAAGCLGWKYGMIVISRAEKDVGVVSEMIKAPGLQEAWLSMAVGLGLAGLVLALITIGRLRKPKPRATF